MWLWPCLEGFDSSIRHGAVPCSAYMTRLLGGLDRIMHKKGTVLPVAKGGQWDHLWACRVRVSKRVGYQWDYHLWAGVDWLRESVLTMVEPGRESGEVWRGQWDVCDYSRARVAVLVHAEADGAGNTIATAPVPDLGPMPTCFDYRHYVHVLSIGVTGKTKLLSRIRE